MSAITLRNALLGLLLATSLPAVAAAQATGRIEGRVVDAKTDAPLAGVRVVVQGGSLGGVSGADGRFSIGRVPSGPRSVTATLVGRAPRTLAGIDVPAAGVARVEIKLATQAVMLDAITVSTSRRRSGGLSAALSEQRTSQGVVNTMSAEQIAKSPDSDAAQAVQRVSGVTLQDGKYVFVRGLGERYSTTSLNGARLPSPDPDRKVVPLDLFPTGVLEGITVSKTFTPDLPGDFSGAQVNLKTRSFPARRTHTYSASVGINGAATFQDVLAAPTATSEWLAYAGADRDVPPVLSNGSTPSGPEGVSSALGSFRNVWSADRASGLPNGSFSGSLGGQEEVFGMPLGYIGSLSYSTSQEVRKNEERALAVSGGDGTARAINAFQGSTGRQSVLWGGILNLSMQVGDGSRLALNNTYDRTADNEAIQLGGLLEEIGTDVDVTRLTYTERSILSSQLVGDHIFADRHRIDWAGTLSGVSRHEPDRSDLVYLRDPMTGQFVWKGDSRSATRTFSDLDESSRTAEANYTFRFADDVDATSFKMGGLFRHTEREADSRAYDILNTGLTSEQAGLPAEQIFNGQFSTTGDGRLGLRPNINGGFYRVNDNLGAGYAMFDLAVLPRVRLVAGARLEWDRVRIDARDVSGRAVPAELETADVLPSVALNWEPSDWQKVRLSATQTLSRPEYREMVPITWFDHLGGRLSFGNPDLERALVRNYDLRWELYPTSDEIVSVGVFAKDFDRPIERVLVSSTGASQVSFVNTERAFNYGLEMEMRRGLGTLADALDPLTVFANATLVRSQITVGNESTVALTNNRRPMTGQAPYVLNTGLTYTGAGERTATLLYNVVGRRIYEVGTGGVPDAYEMPRHMLDLSLQLPLKGASLKLDAENLLDAPYELRQGEVVSHRYTSGRTFSLGVSVRR